jgi:hypothetical protein
MEISIVSRPCDLCSGRGLLRPRCLCPLCEGAGHVPRLRLVVPVVAAAEALAFDGPWWTRLLVTGAESSEGRTVARGVTESGRAVTTLLRPGALTRARHALFEEKGSAT